MLDDIPLPTLADLVRLDWLILENKRLIDESRQSIAQRGVGTPASLPEQSRYAKLLEEQKKRIAERQVMRDYFAGAGEL